MIVQPITVLKYTKKWCIMCVYALEKGLLYSNVKSDKVLVTTVEDNTNIYTIRVYSSAEKASELQNIIGRPST